MKQAMWIVALTILLLGTTPSHMSAAPAHQDAAPLAPPDLYTEVSPAIVQIFTEWGPSGSGILIERRGAKYIVTNQHVVWPFREADVIFPNGEELLAVPVVDWDVMVDVAVLGPVDVEQEPSNLSARRRPVTGETAYLFGYPSEWEAYAQPTMSQGIIARTRTWAQAGVSYLQVDAEIAGGQSGGALVADDGTVIGLATFYVADDGSFGLALAAGDVLRRIDGILRGRDVDNLGERFRVLDDADDGQTIRLNSYQKGALDYVGDVDIFRIDLEKGQTVYLWIEAMGYDPYVAIGPADEGVGAIVTEDYTDMVVFGLVSDLYYEVPADGEYLVLVSDMETLSTGGYFVGVDYVLDE